MAEKFPVLWRVAFLLMGRPGPAILSLAITGTAFGFLRGLPNLAGIWRGFSQMFRNPDLGQLLSVCLAAMPVSSNAAALLGVSTVREKIYS